MSPPPAEGVSRGQTLPLLLPQPQARRVAIGELDAGLFQHALDRRESVPGRIGPALFESHDDVLGHQGRAGQFDLSHVEEPARRSAQRRRDFRS